MMRALTAVMAGLARRPPRPSDGLTVEADRAVALGAGTAAVIAGAFSVWMAAAPLTSAVTVEGVGVVEDKRKVVQHITGGIVAKVLVAEGQSVAAGAPLILLDATAANARFEEARAAWLNAELRHARLQAERRGLAELDIPDRVARDVPADELRPLAERERSLMHSRQAQLRLQRASLAAESAELRAKLEGLEADRKSKGAQSELVERELQGTRQLYEKGYSPLTRVLALERSRAALMGDRDRAAAGSRETREAIAGRQVALHKLEADRQAEIADELARVAGSLDAMRAAKDDAALARQLTTIAAPAAGRVIGLTVQNGGAVIAPGAVILEIVPDGDRLLLEGPVEPSDGPHVGVGAPVRVRFLSDPAYDAPLYAGKVAYVSDDIMPNGPYQGRYKVQVEIRQAERSVRPGAPVVMFIETDTRTPLSYLASPVVEIVQRSLRER